MVDQSAQSITVQSYRPQLDALRAFAVTSVLYTHFWSDQGPGHHGVRLFFVISGFLITGILLELKDEPAWPLRSKLWTFYARRTLRIWPTYYLTLLAAWLVDLDEIRGSMLWHATYTSNYYYIAAGKWVPGVAAHLWSLSVEEQFYLIWPLTVLCTPVRKLGWVIGAAVAGAAAYRLMILLYWTGSPDALNIATPACFDALGMGAALALLKHLGFSARVTEKWLYAAAAASIVTYVALINSRLLTWEGAYTDFLMGIVFSSAVVTADRGITGVWGRLLEWRPIIYVGRISYGLYLYHLFVKYVSERIGERAGIHIPEGQPWRFLVFTLLTMMTATISWYAVERPLASFKRHLPYVRRRTTPSEQLFEQRK